MGFYPTTENPCVMMRENHKTKSCECIIIHQDELYIASSTFQEIIHIVKDKYNIKINLDDYQGSNFPFDPGTTLICLRKYMKKLHINDNMLFKHKLPQDLHTEFQNYQVIDQENGI